MFEMRRLLFHFLPQVLHRVEVWRVSWQLFNHQPLGVCLEKHLHRLARVITGSILHHDHMGGRLRQDIEQKGHVALCVETPSVAFVEKWPGKIAKLPPSSLSKNVYASCV